MHSPSFDVCCHLEPMPRLKRRRNRKQTNAKFVDKIHSHVVPCRYTHTTPLSPPTHYAMKKKKCGTQIKNPILSDHPHLRASL